MRTRIPTQPHAGPGVGCRLCRCAPQLVSRALRDTVRSSSLWQAASGALAAGPGRAYAYVSAKLGKALNASAGVCVHCVWGKHTHGQPLASAVCLCARYVRRSAGGVRPQAPGLSWACGEGAVQGARVGTDRGSGERGVWGLLRTLNCDLRRMARDRTGRPRELVLARFACFASRRQCTSARRAQHVVLDHPSRHEPTQHHHQTASPHNQQRATTTTTKRNTSQTGAHSQAGHK